MNAAAHLNRICLANIAWLGVVLSAAPGFAETIAEIGKATSQSTALSDNDSRVSTNQQVLRVALYDGRGNGGVGVTNVYKQLSRRHGTTVQCVTPEEIQQGKLKGFDAIIFTG